MTDVTINICQPGHGASCALCCGSHHPESAFLREAGRSGFPLRPPGVADGMQCSCIGYLDAGKKTIGCLVYASERPPRVESLFRTTCTHFSCRAREVLSGAEILFAAQLMRDWYYYALLVNSIDLLRELTARYRTTCDVPREVLEGVRASLEARALVGD